MSEKLKESLSAAIDDEADEFELRRVLDEMAKDPELRASWSRYELIGAVMRDQPVSDDALRDRVWDALQGDVVEAETGPALAAVAGEPRQAPAPGRASRFALAASVALAVVVGVGAFNDWGGGEVTVDVVQEDPLVLEQENAIAQAVALKQEVTPQDETRTEAYRLYHLQTQGVNQPGPGAFVRMVTYQKQ